MKYPVSLTTDEYYMIWQLADERQSTYDRFLSNSKSAEENEEMVKWLQYRVGVLVDLKKKLEKTKGVPELPPLDLKSITGMWTYDSDQDDFYWTGFDGSIKPRRKAIR